MSTVADTVADNADSFWGENYGIFLKKRMRKRLEILVSAYSTHIWVSFAFSKQECYVSNLASVYCVLCLSS